MREGNGHVGRRTVSMRMMDDALMNIAVDNLMQCASTMALSRLRIEPLLDGAC
jgi:hypothetical protein